MLQSPKLRGDFGEFTLEQMLRDLLPAEHYECQASIGTGRVDALIRTPYGSLCIECKFPLDNFRLASQATEPAARDAAMKLFYSDVKGRIKEIGDRYVLPPQTLDVAFMFVPAENVYYEVIGRPDLLTYGREFHVVPVSPNTMYAYIQALAVGFRGMKIQEEAKRGRRSRRADTRFAISRIIQLVESIRQREESIRARARTLSARPRCRG